MKSVKINRCERNNFEAEINFIVPRYPEINLNLFNESKYGYSESSTHLSNLQFNSLSTEL